jgi:hypothetical protein
VVAVRIFECGDPHFIAHEGFGRLQSFLQPFAKQEQGIFAAEADGNACTPFSLPASFLHGIPATSPPLRPFPASTIQPFHVAASQSSF